MKIREVIDEFVPCEVCGNRDIKNFYFHVYVHQGSQPYVKCCECKEEYYSAKARAIITRIEDARKVKTPSVSILENRRHDEKQEHMHPLVRVLSGI